MVQLPVSILIYPYIIWHERRRLRRSVVSCLPCLFAAFAYADGCAFVVCPAALHPRPYCRLLVTCCRLLRTAGRERKALVASSSPHRVWPQFFAVLYFFLACSFLFRAAHRRRLRASVALFTNGRRLHVRAPLHRLHHPRGHRSLVYVRHALLAVIVARRHRSTVKHRDRAPVPGPKPAPHVAGGDVAARDRPTHPGDSDGDWHRSAVRTQGEARLGRCSWPPVAWRHVAQHVAGNHGGPE